jgi:hypothetical protein
MSKVCGKNYDWLAVRFCIFRQCTLPVSFCPIQIWGTEQCGQQKNGIAHDLSHRYMEHHETALISKVARKLWPQHPHTAAVSPYGKKNNLR